jgi:hypothetical protein
MTGHDIHLVGSIPLRNASEVFQTVGATLGPRLLRIPDGETGERSHWLGWIEPIFSRHPAFEPTGKTSRVHATSDARPLHRIKPGISPGSISFGNLRIADTAAQSFQEFQRLKVAGSIPSHCRYQVALANPISVVHRFVADEFQEPIQWDIAQHIFTPLETGRPTRFGKNREEMLSAFSAMAIRWGNAVPVGVELLYHLCYEPAV